MPTFLLLSLLLGFQDDAFASECKTVSPEAARAVQPLAAAHLVKIVPFGCSNYVVMDDGAGTLVTRMLPTGEVDATFGDASGSVFVPVNGMVRDAVTSGDGSLLALAEIGEDRGGVTRSVFRILRDGSLDRTFGRNGVLTLPGKVTDVGQALRGGSALVAHSGGKWTLVASKPGPNGRAGELVLMRFDQAGNPDPTYGQAGTIRLMRPGIREAHAAAHHRIGPAAGQRRIPLRCEVAGRAYQGRAGPGRAPGCCWRQSQGGGRV